MRSHSTERKEASLPVTNAKLSQYRRQSWPFNAEHGATEVLPNAEGRWARIADCVGDAQ